MQALDSIYRQRWEEYHLVDGRILDSRQINWRQVEWEKVVKLVACLRGYRHEVTPADKPKYQGMVRFRWGGAEATYDSDRNYTGHKSINIWSIGWTDGIRVYMIDIDFKTGVRLRDWTAPIREYRGHIHPRLRLIL